MDAPAQQHSRQPPISGGTNGEELVRAETDQPDLIVDNGNLPATARELRDLLAGSGRLFDRGVPVKVIQATNGGPLIAERLTLTGSWLRRTMFAVLSYSRVTISCQ
jgi:hypothetical protein